MELKNSKVILTLISCRSFFNTADQPALEYFINN